MGSIVLIQRKKVTAREKYSTNSGIKKAAARKQYSTNRKTKKQLVVSNIVLFLGKNRPLPLRIPKHVTK